MGPLRHKVVAWPFCTRALWALEPLLKVQSRIENIHALATWWLTGVEQANKGSPQVASTSCDHNQSPATHDGPMA